MSYNYQSIDHSGWKFQEKVSFLKNEIFANIYFLNKEWIHLLLEYQIPLEICFPSILWNSVFHRIHGTLNTIFHDICGKSFSNVLIDGRTVFHKLCGFDDSEFVIDNIPAESGFPLVDEFISYFTARFAHWKSETFFLHFSPLCKH